MLDWLFQPGSPGYNYFGGKKPDEEDPNAPQDVSAAKKVGGGGGLFPAGGPQADWMPNMGLLGAGLGIMRPGPEGLDQAFKGLMVGSQFDQARAKQFAQQQALRNYFAKNQQDPTLTSLAVANPDIASQAVLQNLLKAKGRMLTTDEKMKAGLQANLPWMMKPDGGIGLPEGLSSTKDELKQDNQGNWHAVPATFGGSANAGGTPGGAGSAATTPTARPVAGIPQVPKFDEVMGIRKEITNLDEVKRYTQAIAPYRSMLSSRHINSTAADIDFVYGVAKIFDPDSVVREGEMVIVRKTQSLPEQVQGWLQRVLKGGESLTPEARERILDVANTRMNELKGSMDMRIKPYMEIGQRYNIKPEDIMPQMPDLPPRTVEGRDRRAEVPTSVIPGANPVPAEMRGKSSADLARASPVGTIGIRKFGSKFFQVEKQPSGAWIKLREVSAEDARQAGL